MQGLYRQLRHQVWPPTSAIPEAADSERGSVAELGCVSWSLMDLKLCQSKASLRNIPKEDVACLQSYWDHQ